MTAADIDSKKRKRKHKSKKDEDEEPVKAASNGVAAAEKPRKKSKKVHTPEPEEEPVVDGDVAEPSENGVDSEEENEEELNAELKKIAAKAKKSKTSEKEESEDEENEVANGANSVALPSGTSIPTLEDPTRFDELKLSDRTMEAIKTMGFETMTEIQRKAIPPLLRYSSKSQCMYLTNVIKWKGRTRSSEDRKWKDSRLPHTRDRDALSYAIQAPQRHRCHRRIAHSRTRPTDIRSCARAHGEALTDIWHRNRWSEPESGGREARQGRQSADCDTWTAVGPSAQHARLCLQELEELDY
jgi:hypothetical protein